jgi:hypothetical protein
MSCRLSYKRLMKQLTRLRLDLLVFTTAVCTALSDPEQFLFTSNCSWIGIAIHKPRSRANPAANPNYICTCHLATLRSEAGTGQRHIGRGRSGRGMETQEDGMHRCGPERCLRLVHVSYIATRQSYIHPRHLSTVVGLPAIFLIHLRSLNKASP